MDVLLVRDAVGRAVERARRDKTPALIEARTYRFRGHSMRDPSAAVYRTKEELEREKLRDPIALFRERLMKENLLGEMEWQTIEKEVTEIVEEAVVFAENSPEPPLEWLLADVYRETGGRRNQPRTQGREPRA
jgi:TPP-dependent pyruvate/acetoin dehydrogenase alpha subunit